jgi:hypothetical protein
MSSQTKFYMDGTFDNCPKYFLQLFCIHVYANDTYIPVLYCTGCAITYDKHENDFKTKLYLYAL